MSLRQFTWFLLVPFLVAACNGDDALGDVEPVVDPQATIGEPVIYRGAAGTDLEWELTVVVEGIDCGDDGEVAPVIDGLCVVSLRLANTGDEPNAESFAQGSSLITDTGELGVADEIASGAYVDEQGLDPFIWVPPGETAETALVFDMPEEGEPASLRLQAGADDEMILIDLESESAAGDG